MMIYAANLAQDLDCNKVCQKIQRGLERYYKEYGSLDNKVLTINIQNMIDGSIVQQVPLLEKKDLDCNT